ncbi:MAG: hypothetical protein AAB131_24365, partial [Actinomycetota bacterium]
MVICADARESSMGGDVMRQNFTLLVLMVVGSMACRQRARMSDESGTLWRWWNGLLHRSDVPKMSGRVVCVVGGCVAVAVLVGDGGGGVGVLV